jgi:hypothetical protein
MTQKQKSQLTANLRNLSETTLNKVVIEVDKSIEAGFHPQKAFTEGITVDPDQARIRYISKPEDHQHLLDFLNGPHKPNHRGMRVFTLGIFRDDFIQTEISLGDWSSGG